MKLRECKIYGQPCYPQVSRQSPRGWESSRTIAEDRGREFVANLPVKLLMERLSCRPIESDHFECYDRTPAPLLKGRFLVRHCHLASWKSLFHLRAGSQETTQPSKGLTHSLPLISASRLKPSISSAPL